MPMAMDQQEKGAAATRCPSGGAATKRGADGGGSTTRGADSDGSTRSSTFHLLTKTSLLLLLLLNYLPTMHGFGCLETKTEDGKAKVHTDINDVDSGKGSNKAIWCFLLYNVAGQDDIRHTYLAGSSNTKFGIKVDCSTITGCHLMKTPAGSQQNKRLDFVCCCKNNYCNLPVENKRNARLQFEVELKKNNQQICRVDFAQNGRIDNCSRLTDQTESTNPSKCRSFLKSGGSDPVLGCAHDQKRVDQCNWASPYAVTSGGICRETRDGVECCCEGKFCNGDDYMNMMTCRKAIGAIGGVFTYVPGNCNGTWPTTTTISKTDASAVTPTNKENAPTSGGEADTTTTTDSDSSSLMWIGVVVMGVLLVVALVVISGCGVWNYKLRQHVLYPPLCDRDHIQEANELSGVTIGVDRRTASEREDDDLKPRDLINPAEKADEQRQLGHQPAGTSVTINPNEGSDFGDHTLATGGVFDDDSEAAHTTAEKPIATTTDKANTNQTTNKTTSTKATNQTPTPSTNQGTKKSNVTTQNPTAANDKKNTIK